jgi:hypothetical protein
MNLPTHSSKSVVLVGGPDAGKTNYLGRLWMALDAEKGAIAKHGLPAQVEYLRAIATSLNSGKFAPRTAPGVFESTTIPVKWSAAASVAYGELIVPDCAGEQWERIHREREWNSEWEQAVASMAGCILFFRGTSEHNISPIDWSNDTGIMKCLSDSKSATDNQHGLPTQVVLVDWLQCLSSAYRDIHGSEHPLRVAIVLSAWDMVPKEAKEADPSTFLSKELPLLHDFLSTNISLYQAKPFGVSIAGGILTDDNSKFMTTYLDGDPNSAGYVVLSSGGKVLKSNDLTLPLAWAFGRPCPEIHERGSANP